MVTTRTSRRRGFAVAAVAAGLVVLVSDGRGPDGRSPTTDHEPPPDDTWIAPDPEHELIDEPMELP